MKRNLLPSVERLHEAFSYCPDTGALTWKVQPRGRGKKGSLAGGPNSLGYTQVVIDRGHFLSHRIIWKMVTGEEPPESIDHIDGDTSNNRFTNFRSATVSENLCNSKICARNTSGVKGISYDNSPKRRKRWRAVIMKDQKYIQVGRFHTMEEAVAALDEARERLHGEFARAA